MHIVLNNISKRYRYEWIFRGIDYHFKAGGNYAILGPNGSGKSTLIKILSGHLSPSKGQIDFLQAQKKIDLDQLYRSVSIATPYMDLIEEFSLREAIGFHQRFKPFYSGLGEKEILKLIGLKNAKDKEIRFFSSGMKQRLKLALAICSDTPLLLLDEPSTNLDEQGSQWYRQLIDQYNGADRITIVASNVALDYEFCNEKIVVMDYKKKVKKPS